MQIYRRITGYRTGKLKQQGGSNARSIIWQTAIFLFWYRYLFPNLTVSEVDNALFDNFKRAVFILLSIIIKGAVDGYNTMQAYILLPWSTCSKGSRMSR